MFAHPPVPRSTLYEMSVRRTYRWPVSGRFKVEFQLTVCESPFADTRTWSCVRPRMNATVQLTLRRLHRPIATIASGG